MLMLIAGHDSTVNTIAHCVLTLLRNPESLDLLRERPELIPKAIEEVLRLQSAVQFFPSRSVTADIEIGGTVIPKGSAVHLLYGAANRDPKRFPDPEKFDIQRPDNQHVGWGRGVHSCGRSACPLRGQPGGGEFPAPRRESAPGRRSAALPAEPDLPRPTASRGRVRPDHRLEAPSRPSSSSNGNSRANSGTCRCPNPGPGRYW